MERPINKANRLSSNELLIEALACEYEKSITFCMNGSLCKRKLDQKLKRLIKKVLSPETRGLKSEK